MEDNYMETLPIDFKLNLSAARNNVRLTQKQAAELLGVSQVTLNRWGRGKTKPRFDKIEEMAQLYKCPIQMLEV